MATALTWVAALMLGHEVSDDAVRVDPVLVGHFIAERLVETRRLEVEGFQIEAKAAMIPGSRFERANERGPDALVACLRRDPKLLEFTALTPPTTYGATDDLAIFISGEARQWLNLVQRCRCVVGLTETNVDDVRFGPRQAVVNADGERHGGSCAALIAKVTGGGE